VVNWRIHAQRAGGRGEVTCALAIRFAAVLCSHEAVEYANHTGIACHEEPPCCLAETVYPGTAGAMDARAEGTYARCKLVASSVQREGVVGHQVRQKQALADPWRTIPVS
jgi:hypothetical protein